MRGNLVRGIPKGTGLSNRSFISKRQLYVQRSDSDIFLGIDKFCPKPSNQHN